MATIKEIAKIVGVSPTTVSNVIHGRRNKVSAKNYKKVKRALEENNYVSNMGGWLLGRHGSRIIGVILNYSRRSEINVVSDPFYNQLIGFLEEQIRNKGFFMMLYTSASVPESMKFVTAWDIEGLIILGALPEDAKEFIQQAKKPLAFIDAYVDAKSINKSFINIGLDDYRGGYEITKYLISLGHRNIGFCADGKKLIGVDQQRFLGFKQALKEAGIEFDDRYFFGLDYRMANRHKELIDLLNDKLPNLTALVFTSDFLAIDAINVFLDHGIKVPDDVSITGFDHNIFSKLFRPRLTTVEQNIRKKAELAVNCLMQCINRKENEMIDQKLDVKLIIGESTTEK
ncbi:MAG: LacI family transcriptional regulator [Sporolactobacillus sp.]|jgi:LacI family transcriptional regulator|nr:LacI family transcriptional regulator [Sporolactobacillus sp.]